jgi:tetratricopeptide (TPR) repeat protein
MLKRNAYNRGWSLEAVENVKAEVRSELAERYKEGGMVEKRRYLLGKIAELSDQTDAKEQLRLLIYIISCLILHSQYGGLKATQVKRAFDLAQAVLKVNQVGEKNSKLSFLHSEIHLVKSQLYRASGDTWAAAWESCMVQYSTKSEEFERVNTLTLGNRYFRLGFCKLAVSYYDKFLSLNPDGENWSHAVINKIKCFRLSHQWEKAKEAYDFAMANQERFQQTELCELKWEKYYLEFRIHQRPDPMIAAVRFKRSHHVASYLCEVSLLSKAVVKREHIFASTKICSLEKRRDMQVKKLGSFYKAARVLEECYDYDIPVLSRIQAVGQVLTNLDRLKSVDKELLVLAAAARFLFRVKASDFGALALNRYIQKSLQLTLGLSQDALGIAQDMIDRQNHDSQSDHHSQNMELHESMVS